MWSDSVDARTCGGYLCSPPSYVLQVLQVLQQINSLTQKVSLNEFQASCYSHHRSQSALSETNRLLRVLGCNPYLESLPNYIDGAPPWTPTNRGHGITSRPLKHYPGISPRDPKDLRTDHILYIFNQSWNIHHTCQCHINLCNHPSFVSRI